MGKGSADMTDLPLVRALSEPVNQHGPGIVGDSGERSDVHPVYEIESNFDVSPGAAFHQPSEGRSMAMRKRDDEVVFSHAAGIDVGASSHWVAVPGMPSTTRYASSVP